MDDDDSNGDDNDDDETHHAQNLTFLVMSRPEKWVDDATFMFLFFGLIYTDVKLLFFALLEKFAQMI